MSCSALLSSPLQPLPFLEWTMFIRAWPSREQQTFLADQLFFQSAVRLSADFVLDASVEDGRQAPAADGAPDVYELQKMVAAKEEELNYFVERCESLMR